MDERAVGEWVRQQIDTRKMSIKTAAERSNLSRQTWYDLMSDKHPPSIETQRGVAEALSVEPGWYDALRAGREPQALIPGDEVSQLRAELAALRDTVLALESMLLERLEMVERMHVDPRLLPGASATPPELPVIEDDQL